VRRINRWIYSWFYSVVEEGKKLGGAEGERDGIFLGFVVGNAVGKC